MAEGQAASASTEKTYKGGRKKFSRLMEVGKRRENKPVACHSRDCRECHSHYPHSPEDLGEEEEARSLVEGRGALGVVRIVTLNGPVLSESLRRCNDSNSSTDDARRVRLSLLFGAA